MAYGIGGNAEFGFNPGNYDPTRPIVLHPAVLVYCGFIGGSAREWANGIAVDALGNAYVTGEADSAQNSFPVKVGSDLTYNGGNPPYAVDAFVAKVNTAGTGALLMASEAVRTGPDSGVDPSHRLDGAGPALHGSWRPRLSSCR
jgi:hypothetical protein